MYALTFVKVDLYVLAQYGSEPKLLNDVNIRKKLLCKTSCKNIFVIKITVSYSTNVL